MFALYPHQQQAIEDLRAGRRAGHLRQILAMPTGSGKTVVASHLAHAAAAKDKKVLFIVDRIELVGQAVRHLAGMGLSVGVMQGENTDFSRTDEVIVASIQTIRARSAPYWVDVIIIDEVHILHRAHIDLMEAWNLLPFIGLSATPLREDLGKYFTHLVRGPAVAWLTEHGFLVPAKAFCPGAEHIGRILDGVATRAGDFVEQELAAALNRKELVGDIVRTWQEHGEGRSTLCFAIDIAHSKSIVEDFQAAGIAAAHLDAYTAEGERKDLIARFRAGEITILSSVNVLGIGFDVPDAACAILARPTLSEALDMQQKGRVIRPAEGKVDAILLDHAGNTLRFGLPIHFEVPDLDAQDRPTTKAKRKQTRMVACSHCGFALEPDQRTCPNCGIDRPTRSPKLRVVDGELVAYGDYTATPAGVSVAQKRDWYAGFVWYAKMRLGKDREATLKYAFANHLDKFKGEKPAWSWRGLPPLPPSDEQLRWLHSRQIRWAHSKRRHQR